MMSLSTPNSTASTNISATTPPPDPRPVIAILSTALIIGFPGNAFVIWTILTRMKKRTVTCLLILHLAIADLLVILTAPFFLHPLATGSWVFGLAICKICYYVCGLSMYTSIFLITFMSMDRFLAVAFPFTSHKVRTKPFILGIISAIWMVAALMAIPSLFYRDVKKVSGFQLCVPFHGLRDDNSTAKHLIFQYLFETITGFIIPFTVILSCYVFIGLRLRRARFQTKQKTSQLVIMIIMIFALFWLPYIIVIMMQVSAELLSSPTLRNAAWTARASAITFAYFSSSANPILYVFAGGNLIRTAGVRFMAKLFEGTHSEASRFQTIPQAFRQKSHESVKLKKCRAAL